MNSTVQAHRGTLILVLGIIGLVCCAPCGLAAWIMGSGDLKQMDEGRMDDSGRSITNGGKICGMIATILLALGIIIWGGLFLLGALASAGGR